MGSGISPALAGTKEDFELGLISMGMTSTHSSVQEPVAAVTSPLNLDNRWRRRWFSVPSIISSATSASTCDSMKMNLHRGAYSSNKSMYMRRGSYSSERSVSSFRSTRSGSLQANIIRSTTGDINSLSSFTKESVLGSGMSATVTKVKSKDDGRQYAIKSIKLQNVKSKEYLRREIAVLKNLDHLHIAKLYEFYELPGIEVNMVIELGNGGDLYRRLQEVGRFPEKRVVNIVKQMLSALQYIHEKEVIHRDLKLENWVFRNKNSDDIMVIDFGLCSTFADVSQNKKRSRVGTSYYIAPESIRGEYSSACDMWSTGVIVYMLLSGQAPFGGVNDSEVIFNILNGEYRFKESVWRGICSEDGKDFIRCLLQRNREERLTAEEALQHPWIVNNTEPLESEISPEQILKRLTNFGSLAELKKLIIRIIAYNTAYSEMDAFCRVFEIIDTKRKGYIILEDLERYFFMNDIEISREEIKTIFDNVDFCSQGCIGVSDFIAATLPQQIYQDEHRIKKAFGRINFEANDHIMEAHIQDFIGNGVASEFLRKHLPSDLGLQL